MIKKIAIVRYNDKGVPCAARYDATERKMSVHMQALLHWLHGQSIQYSVTYTTGGEQA